jgi:predicted RND superfamily exporter protein
MAFLFLSWRMILISLVPNIIPLIITLGIMGFGDIHLKASTIIIFSITYGISIDFTIHFLAKYRYFLKKNQWAISPAVSDSILESGVSIVYTSVILFCGFIIFAFSTFGGTVALGLLTSITLFIGMFMNLLLLPAMLVSLEKYINMKKELSNQLIDFDGE